MTRKALPHDYIIDKGSVMLEIDDATGWSTENVVTDTTNFITGTGALKITSGLGTQIATKKTISLNAVGSQIKGIWLYIHPPVANFKNLTIYLGSINTLAKHFYNNSFAIVEGWNYISLPDSRWVSVNGESWDNILNTIQITVIPQPGVTASVTVDCLRKNIHQLPRCLIMFDDAAKGVYDYAYPCMASKGIPGTIYTIPSNVDRAGTMTLSELQTCDAIGWAIANHTYNHSDLTILTDVQIETEIKSCVEWLVANGLSRAAYHLAYPFGTYNDAVLAVMAAMGMKTGRRTSGTSGRLTTPPANTYLLPSYSVTHTTSLATAKLQIDNAIANQEGVSLYFHNIVDGVAAEGQWSKSNFEALIDYIVERKIKCVTIDEWYEGLTNPRYRSIPLSRATV